MPLNPITVISFGVIVMFGIGIYGLLVVRNLIKIVIVLQLLVKTAMLALIAASAHTDQLALGQSLAVTVLAADTVVAVIGLALAIQVKQRIGTLDLAQLSSLRK